MNDFIYAVTLFLKLLALLCLLYAAWFDAQTLFMPLVALNLASCALLLLLILKKSLYPSNLSIPELTWFFSGAMFLLTTGSMSESKRLIIGFADLRLLFAGWLAGSMHALLAMISAGLVFFLAGLAGKGSLDSKRCLRLPLAPAMLAGLLLFVPMTNWGQQNSVLPEIAIEALDFTPQALTDIIQGISLVTSVAIIADQTVSGQGAWYFPKGTLSGVMDAFLKRYGLFIEKQGDAWLVSRIKLFKEADGTLVVNTSGVAAQDLLQSISQKLAVSIVYESLPSKHISISYYRGKIDELFPLIMAQLPGFIIEKKAAAWFITAEKSKTNPADKLSNGSFTLAPSGQGLWSLELDKARLGDVLSNLASQAGFELSVLVRTDMVLEKLSYKAKTRDELLRLLCELSNLDFVFSTSLCYVIEGSKRDVFRHLKRSEVLVLKYVPVGDLSALLAPDLVSAALYRIDKDNNSLILYGLEQEIRYFKAFVAQVDKANYGRKLYVYQCLNQRAKDVATRVPAWANASEVQVFLENNSLQFTISSGNQDRLLAWLQAVDVKADSQPIRLRYIQTSDLLAQLPPSINKDELVAAGNTLVYYTGPLQRFEHIKQDIARIDVPQPQVRYQILLVEYSEGESLTLNASSSTRETVEGDHNFIVGALGPSLNIGFDLLSGLGASFTSALSSKLSNNKARVLADTSLQGLSGQELKFQNTSTYRYLEPEIDPDTGKEKNSGITREITSGLIVSLNGWVSGDGMITMNLSATISKRGAGGGDEKLSTSERVLSTRVRTPSGQALSVGGLLQRNSSQDLALLSYGYETSVSELCIYVLPFVEYGLSDEQLLESDLAEFQNRFLDLSPVTKQE